MLSLAKLTGCEPGNRAPSTPHSHKTTFFISRAWPSYTVSPRESSWCIFDPSLLPDAVVLVSEVDATSASASILPIRTPPQAEARMTPLWC